MHELLKKAGSYALMVHNTQKYGEIYPYYKHLEDVYNVLVKFGFTEEENLELLTAAWLHDAIEDTATSYSDIRGSFGVTVAEIVYCMTDEMGRNRKERKAKTYPKTRSNPSSVILKVADRIANVEFSSTQDTGHLDMYKKEFTDFEYNLRIHDHITEMWEHLKQILAVESAIELANKQEF